MKQEGRKPELGVWVFEWLWVAMSWGSSWLAWSARAVLCFGKLKILRYTNYNTDVHVGAHPCTVTADRSPMFMQKLHTHTHTHTHLNQSMSIDTMIDIPPNSSSPSSGQTWQKKNESLLQSKKSGLEKVVQNTAATRTKLSGLATYKICSNSLQCPCRHLFQWQERITLTALC